MLGAQPDPAPFVVLGLPRSRTTWLARFLTYRDWRCGHDELRHCRQIEDVKSWLDQPQTGTVETAAAPFWRLALHLRPDLRIVTVRRDPREAAAAAIRAGLGSDLDIMTDHFLKLDLKLGQIERRTGCYSIHFKDLTDEGACAALFEHLLPYGHDHRRWRELDRTPVLTDVAALNRYVVAHSVQIGRLGAIARRKSLALLTGRRPHDMAGVTMAFEPLATLLSDGDALIREHIAAVGEHPDGLASKNLSRLQALDEAGALQVTTARCNGRIFGYLVTTMGESLEAENRLWACHTAFYASPAFAGVGLKLQRKAIDGLRERGVFEVVGRAGVRGAAERQAALYQRLGYEPFGTYYRLQIGEP